MTLRAVASHPMETGYRRDVSGKVIPRDILNKLTCTYDGTEIFRAEFFPAVAANPFISFTTVATKTGAIVFTWTDDAGKTISETAQLTVTG
jgi:sulfur-oxidizing protein SoxZ